MTSFSREDQEAIIQFVFSTEDNLKLALALLSVREEIERRVIGDFCRLLVEELRKRCQSLGPSWDVDDGISDNPFQRWAGLMLVKREWQGPGGKSLYGIAIETGSTNASGWYLGVWNDLRTLGAPIDEGRIKAALEGKVEAGGSNKWWPYWRWLKEEYRDWSDVNTRLRLIGDRGQKAAEEIAESLFEIAKIVEPVIDDIVENWRRSHLNHG